MVGLTYFLCRKRVITETILRQPGWKTNAMVSALLPAVTNGGSFRLMGVMLAALCGRGARPGEPFLGGVSHELWEFLRRGLQGRDYLSV